MIGSYLKTSGRDHLNSLLGEFARIGIRFMALDLNVGSSTPAGKLVLQIFAGLAEYDGTGQPSRKQFGENQGGAVISQSQ